MSNTSPPSFAALRHKGYQAQWSTFVAAMMADNIEHVISYWVMFEKFHSPLLGGFAVISHWLPFLLFSVPAGTYAERKDPRRLIQVGMLMFMVCSLAWAYFFLTDSLTQTEAMCLLVLHGCSGVIWQAASQLLLYEVVPPSELPSAIRLLATGRYLSLLIGPAVGGAVLLYLGPELGLLINSVFYVPTILWLWKAPYGPKFRKDDASSTKRAIKGWSDIVSTIKDVSKNPTLYSMMILAGAASFLMGNSYQAQMPGFVHDLGHDNPNLAYSMLLAADALGALIAGVILEGKNLLPASAKTALILAFLWCISLSGFALASNLNVALVLLVCAGFLELSFSSMTQAIVQLNAPADMRGRVLGLFNMSALGMRAGAGLMVGLGGSWLGIHAAMVISCALLISVVSFLYINLNSPQAQKH